ncbi:phosphopantetheine-binding protein, partial [Pseudomonas sp. SIMBA_077]
DGSLDYYALFPQAGSATADAADSAGDALQTLIGRIWQEQLQCASVAADDHFFLLGGNSIAATQVIARLREELGLELGLR